MERAAPFAAIGAACRFECVLASERNDGCELRPRASSGVGGQVEVRLVETLDAIQVELGELDRRELPRLEEVSKARRSMRSGCRSASF